MSREIKFRAWDFDNKSMIYPDSELGTIFCFDKVGLSIYHCDGYELSSFNVMQYTGLKDKNGKEIYERDILKVYDDFFIEGLDDLYGVVKFNNGRFYLSTFKSYPNECWVNFEVVGNIYENQKLLEEI